MLKVGITGGIGSGKSTVSQLLKLLDVPVYNADEEAKRLMNENAEIREKLLALFGENAYNENGLNRKWISNKVFNDPEQLALLNKIVHPVVIQDGINWMNSQEGPLAVKEAAIFFETGSAAGLDYMIGVFAPESLRILRTMQRDNVTREEVLTRMSRQINEELKMKLCDFVLVNDEVQMLIPQVLALHRELLKKAKGKM